MKIGPNTVDAARVEGRTPGTDRAVPVRGGSSAEPVSGTGAVDRVSLSGAAPTLIGPAAAPPFDERKVEEVKRAIAEGRFPVDARRVADSLLDDARELFRPAGDRR